MDRIILDIAAQLRRTDAPFGNDELMRLLRAANKPLGLSTQFYTKKKLLPFYLNTKANDPARWESWGIDPETERRLVQLLQIKPRRTSSGVATITVITKPWPCSSACIYCPNDIRMPKSYLANEPACQRAERAFFDPYLQVSARLRALHEMGHPTDKVELIVLGGTWSDYPESYQLWFMAGLFRALNEGTSNPGHAEQLRAQYEQAGLSSDDVLCARHAAQVQALIDARTCSYNEAFTSYYGNTSPWNALSLAQHATWEELEALQHANETAQQRNVGLVIETRPDAITPAALTSWRRYGCTKIQMGIQSLDDAVLRANNRATTAADIQRALMLVRMFGFKLHTHFMVNLYGSTAQEDKAGYLRFVTDPAYLPDEVKIYPCVLVRGTALYDLFEQGKWHAYSDDELLDVLVDCINVTPPYTRISRMIRDISSTDIVAGNKKTNLRQLAELQAAETGKPISEMRYREIKGKATDPSQFALETVAYATIGTREFFLQWVTPEHEIAGFLRLSLPQPCAFERFAGALPVQPGQAMIREVHVYGRAAGIGSGAQNAQHLGLGKALIAHACNIAREQGFSSINVISAIGTRAYYRGLGFADAGLYQCKTLEGVQGE